MLFFRTSNFTGMFFVLMVHFFVRCVDSSTFIIFFSCAVHKMISRILIVGLAFIIPSTDICPKLLSIIFKSFSCDC